MAIAQGKRLESTDVDVDLRLSGKVVSRFCVDKAFSLEILEKGARTVIRIGGRMSIEHGGVVVTLSGENPTEATKASILLGKTIGKATGRKDGSLDVGFADGYRLTVPVDLDYEAWELRGSGGFLVVSRPGGGLAIWDSK